MKKNLLLFIASLALASNTQAQFKLSPLKEATIGKFYLKPSAESSIFSFAKNGATALANTTNPVRFSWFLNTGEHVHYNFNSNLGFYTGAEIRNIGYITRTPNQILFSDNGVLVHKVRNYNLGIPVALQFGNIAQRKTFTLGTGLDFALNTKEKFWIAGEKKHKQKGNSWFSSNSNIVNPFFFLAAQRKGFGVKFQLYTNPILKTDVLTNNLATPFYFSIFTDFHGLKNIKTKKPISTNL